MAETEEKKPETKAEPPAERSETTEHQVEIGGRRITYTATAATTTLKADDGTARASVFTVSYVVAGKGTPSERPITYAFNGRPGSSSIWLHLGVLGPRRIRLGELHTPQAPPYRLTDNAESILDLTDLVFIDPVSTGWSRPVDKDQAKEFHGLKEDTEAVGDLIRLLTSRSGRWSSPKFLAGESYGTTRAASLAGYLQERHGLYLNGIVLLSAILLFGTARPARGNDLPYLLYLPSYAATAWYHGRLAKNFKSVDKLLTEVEEFALGDYASVLLRGPRASGAEKASVRSRLAAFTGLSEDYLESADLRITPSRFFKELMRDRRRSVGRLDSRFLGIDPDAAGESNTYDPAYGMIQGAYTAALNAYLRDDLKFDSDVLYEALRGEAVRPWKWGDAGENQYVDVASTLAQAMSVNRSLRVFLGSGIYDLATPYLAAEWTFDHMRLDPEVVGNVVKKRYESGHMMYVHEPSIRRLKKDLQAFYNP